MSADVNTPTRNRSALTRRRKAGCRPSLEQYLELLLGPKDAASAFSSDELRRVAWRDHCSDLLPLVDPGSRPWAWWQYDAPEPRFPRESDLAYLMRCGLVTQGERARLESAGIQPAPEATRKP